MPYKISRERLQQKLADQPALMEVCGLAMQQTMVSAYASATVVCTPEVVIRGRWDGADPGFLGHEFLLNYRQDNLDLGMRLGVARYLAQDAQLSLCHFDLGEDLTGVIPLRKPRSIRAGLTAAVESRRSRRRFAGEPISAADLATVLHHAQGVAGHLSYVNQVEPSAQISLRTSPSGGGMYPISLAVLVIGVDGLEPGIYRYLPIAHALKPLRVSMPAADVVALCDFTDIDVSKASFCLAYVYDLYSNSRKYGPAGLAFALIEVGATSQNMHLAISALGLAGVDQGGYDKQKLERALGLDGQNRHVVHFSIFGKEAAE